MYNIMCILVIVIVISVTISAVNGQFLTELDDVIDIVK